MKILKEQLRDKNEGEKSIKVKGSFARSCKSKSNPESINDSILLLDKTEEFSMSIPESTLK